MTVMAKSNLWELLFNFLKDLVKDDLDESKMKLKKIVI
jgi:hypothetical protein